MSIESIMNAARTVEQLAARSSSRSPFTALSRAREVPELRSGAQAVLRGIRDLPDSMVGGRLIRAESSLGDASWSLANAPHWREAHLSIRDASRNVIAALEQQASKPTRPSQWVASTSGDVPPRSVVERFAGALDDIEPPDIDSLSGYHMW
jgi:hypothetical protein